MRGPRVEKAAAQSKRCASFYRLSETHGKLFPMVLDSPHTPIGITHRRAARARISISPINIANTQVALGECGAGESTGEGRGGGEAV